MSFFTVLPPDIQPDKIRITASVGFVFVEDQEDTLVAIRNKRGWDIPGGHVEAGESPEETLRREILEETGCTVKELRLIAILRSNKQPDTGIAVYEATCIAGPFNATSEILEVRYLSTEELLEIYFGDSDLLKKLVGLINNSGHGHI